MRTLKFYFVALMAICLVACSKNGSVKPVSTKINGPLGDYFEIVDKDYKIKDGEVSIEFKRIAEGGPSDASCSSTPTFIVELIDGDDNTVSSESTDIVMSADQLEAVFALGVGETASVKFEFDETDDAAKLKVSSKWDEDAELEEAPEEISDSSMDDEMSYDSEDWDSVLDAYEEYVDQYVALLKKANNGDLDALSEYASFLEKAQELSEKIESAGDDMSESQLARYTKITMKMTKAF